LLLELARRAIPYTPFERELSNTTVALVSTAHTHYDHSEADKDINCVFPIERLRELAADGTIKAVNADFYGMMGYTLPPKEYRAARSILALGGR